MLAAIASYCDRWTLVLLKGEYLEKETRDSCELIFLSFARRRTRNNTNKDEHRYSHGGGTTPPILAGAGRGICAKPLKNLGRHM